MEPITEINQYFDLGEIKTLNQVTGGLMHKTWRVQTASGTFAIKQINPEVIQRPKARQDYLDSEKIAKIIKDKGIPAVAALTVNDNPLFENEQGTFMVFPWIEGKILVEQATIEQTLVVGEILGKIHSLKLTNDNMAMSSYEETAAIDWDRLINQAKHDHIGWSQIAKRMEEKLIVLKASHSEIMADLNKRRLISHKDMDRKNILWQKDGSPVIIDWESAGQINAGVELVATALDWSGLHETKVDKSLVYSFLKGYYSKGGTFNEDPKLVLRAIEGNWLEWLEYNMRRSIPDNGFPKDERKIAIAEVFKVLTILNDLEKNKEIYSKWF